MTSVLNLEIASNMKNFITGCVFSDDVSTHYLIFENRPSDQ